MRVSKMRSGIMSVVPSNLKLASDKVNSLEAPVPGFESHSLASPLQFKRMKERWGL